jgi:uncharacterized membrane protein
MQNPPPVQTTKSSTGLEANIAALLAYVLGWIGGLVFFLIEKESRFVKFHAMQSILLNVGAFILFIALWVLTVFLMVIGSFAGDVAMSLFGILGTLIWVVFGVGVAIAAILCLIKAFQGQYFKLPVIGNLAEKFSAKYS